MLNIVMTVLISGVALGFVYGLVAIEYTLIFNACGLLNFAHTKTIALGAFFFVGTFSNFFKELYVPSLILAVLSVALIGIIVAHAIFIPLRNYTRVITIMCTAMLGTVMEQGIQRIWGVFTRSSDKFLYGTFKIFGVTVSKAYVIILFVALAVGLAVQLFKGYTKPGQAMTCVAQDKVASELMGIDVKRNMAMSIAISFGICALIGCMIAPIYTVHTGMAESIGFKGYAAGVIGGFGSTGGGIVGGVLLGIVENIGAMVFPAKYKDVFSFALMILFMLVRPSGLVGKKQN